MVGNVAVGGDSPITVQSMINTSTKDIQNTIKQIRKLEEAGCHIVRGAITDFEDAKAIKAIKDSTNLPFVADIQFDYKLAIAAVKNGADCLRINPGNIGSEVRVKEVVKACKEYRIPIRIGVNSGSIKKEYLNKYGGVNENSMVYSALEQIRLLENLNYYNMKISLKASSVPLTIKSYQRYLIQLTILYI